MKNELKVDGNVAIMTVADKSVLFDLDDFSKLDRFATWKLSRRKSIVADYRDRGKMLRITLHRLITGSKFVQWLNGNIFDFRKENLAPIEKSIRPRPCGIGLKYNPFRIEGGMVVLDVLRKGQIQNVFVDCDDFLQVSKYLWNINTKSGYVQAKERLPAGENKGVYLHRIVMDADGFHEKIDHINGNKLDNRKQNLRICTQSQNDHNSLKIRSGGIVGIHKSNYSYWVAHITVNGVLHKKLFHTREEAIAQRKLWEKELDAPISYKDASCNELALGIYEIVFNDWVAQIVVNKKRYYKKFKTREEAIAQRKQWEKELNPSGLNK